MLIIKVMGGLGNQMQQYALYQKLKTLGKEVKLDTTWFTDPAAQAKVSTPRNLELSRFVDLPMEVATTEEIRRVRGRESHSLFSRAARKLKLPGQGIIFEESQMYHPEIFSMEDGYLVGYFACNKYYADIMDLLRRLFVFPESKNADKRAWNQRMAAQMKNPDEISVSIHLRRGDYLNAENAGLLGGIATPEYYGAACRFLEQRFGKNNRKLHFYVFSDDPDFARTCHFGTQGEEVTVCDQNTGSDNMLDMQLMSFCRCNITANSTFSFWGARLNPRPAAEKIAIRPLWHRNNQKPDPAKMHDYWKDFILIDRDGKVV